MKKILLIAAIAGAVLAGCSKDKTVNQAPICTITNPLNNAEFYIGENITIAVVAEDKDGIIAEVQLYVDNAGHSSKTAFPYNFTINAGELNYGTHSLRVVAIDNQGARGETTVNISIIKLEIGDFYQGGIIAYIDETGQHGLIAAPEDQSPSGIRWDSNSSIGIETGATGTTIGTGKSNTEKIIEVQGAGAYAAQLCDDLVLNGYSDWFLPSKDELNELYKNRVEIGGFSYTNTYWSSSETGNFGAWAHYFEDGYQFNASKISTCKVRAVRYF